MNKTKIEYYVPPNLRKNNLALSPGGSTVKVHYENYTAIYDNIKHVEKYINAIKKKDVENKIKSIEVIN